MLYAQGVYQPASVYQTSIDQQTTLAVKVLLYYPFFEICKSEQGIHCIFKIIDTIVFKQKCQCIIYSGKLNYDHF